jgi:hypothetical protein
VTTITDRPQGLTDRAIVRAFMRGSSVVELYRRWCQHPSPTPLIAACECYASQLDEARTALAAARRSTIEEVRLGLCNLTATRSGMPELWRSLWTKRNPCAHEHR